MVDVLHLFVAVASVAQSASDKSNCTADSRKGEVKGNGALYQVSERMILRCGKL